MKMKMQRIHSVRALVLFSHRVITEKGFHRLSVDVFFYFTSLTTDRPPLYRSDVEECKNLYGEENIFFIRPFHFSSSPVFDGNVAVRRC